MRSVKNLGALLAATGAKVEAVQKVFVTDNYQAGFDHTTVPCHAIAGFHPQDALTILEAALKSPLIESPYYVPLGLMDETGFRAYIATNNELDCYALACDVRLSVRDQASLLAYVARARAWLI